MGHFGDGLFRQNAHKHNNGTVSLNFTINRKFILYRNTKHKKNKNEVNLKLHELYYTRRYVINIMVVLIIFPVILQTVTQLL